MTTPETPVPNLSADAARWLLAVTGPMTVRLDHPHAADTVTMAAAVRQELDAIVAAEPAGEVPPEPEPAE